MSIERDDPTLGRLPPLAVAAWPVEDASLAQTFVLGNLNDEFGAPAGDGVVVQVTAPSGRPYRQLFRADHGDRIRLDEAARFVAEQKIREGGWRAFWGMPAPGSDEDTPCWFDSGANAGGRLKARKLRARDGSENVIDFWRVTGDAPYLRLIWQPDDADTLMFSHVPLLDDGEGSRYVDLAPVHVRDAAAAPMQATYGNSLAGLTLLYIARNAVDAARATGEELIRRVVSGHNANADDIIVAASFALEQADQDTIDKLRAWSEQAETDDREVRTYVRVLDALSAERPMDRQRIAQSVLRSLERNDLPRIGAPVKWATWLAQPAAQIEPRTPPTWMRYLQLSAATLGYHSWCLDGPPSRDASENEKAIALAVAKKKSRRLS